jgi:hypothetical protein
MRGAWQPSLSLELALAEVLDAPNEPAPRPSAPPPAATVRGQPRPSDEPISNVDHTQPRDKPAPVSQSEAPHKPAQREEVVKKETDDILYQEAETPRPPEKSAVSTADVIKAWKHLASSLPKSQANLSALLLSVKMIDVQGKTLILGLASDVLVSKIDKPDQIEAIQKLIRDQFGVDMNIRCVVTTAKGKIPPNVPQDGMVAAAIQHGGQIVDM